MLYSPEGLARLFAYWQWANARILESVAGLSAEDFTRPVGGSFGSVQGTYAHVYGADWVWLERWRGRSPRALPDGVSLSTLQEVRDRWIPVQEAHAAFVAGTDAEALTKPLSYVNFAGQNLSYPLGEALLHVVNHGTYHRGQIANLLRQLGHKPVSTDYLRFLDASG